MNTVSTNRAVRRIDMEKQRVIAVDFDGCLCDNAYPDIGAPNWQVIDAALKERADGAALILWTCREGDMLQQALDACKGWGLEFDAVNDSLPKWKETWKNDPRKIGATEYWDDKAVRMPNIDPVTAAAEALGMSPEPGYDASANLGAYRPEFWYSIEPQTGGGILFVVADGKLPGYHYSPPYMLTSCFVANDGSGGLQCKSGDIQCDSVSLNNYNTMNAAQGMLTEDYWADGAEKLLLTVEFAEMNSQKVTGNGFTGARYNENDVAQKTEAAANSVVVLAAAASNFVAGSQTIGLGTSLGGNQKMKHRKLIEIADYEGDATLKRLVFDGAPVDVAQGDIVYSTSAVFDGAPVGHGSGYVGANGKAISYYRGAALQTGAYMWIANILRASDETVWVAPSDATQTGAIGEDWINTGLTLPTAEGMVKHLAVSKKCPLVIQPDAVGNGATSTAPVGDYFYRPQAGAGITALLSRGSFAGGSYAGAWCGFWLAPPSFAYWSRASRSLIRNPFGGTGVATPVTPD